jgi:hypothetical protein
MLTLVTYGILQVTTNNLFLSFFSSPSNQYSSYLFTIQ